MASTKTEGAKKLTAEVGEKVSNMVRTIGGGEKKMAALKELDAELKLALNILKGALQAKKEARLQAQQARAVQDDLSKRIYTWKNPTSVRNTKRVEDAANAVSLTLKAYKVALLKARNANKLFKEANQLATDRVRKLVLNRGIRRLGAVGLTIPLGFGVYNVLSEEQEPQLLDSSNSTPSQYMYDPNKGWQEYNQKLGQYENQLLGFGIDRFGNTNYYDGQNWLTPDLYMQGSNGLIYNKQTGQVIGSTDDILEAHNNGYDNVFDYRAAKAGYYSPEVVKLLQTQLGITADGKWGQLTLDAFDRAAKEKWGHLYDINNLFSIYLNRV